MKLQAVGKLSSEHQELVRNSFVKHGLELEFKTIDTLEQKKLISFDKKTTKELKAKNIDFYNWDLLFSVLGPNDTQGEIEKKLDERIRVLKSVLSLNSKPQGQEFHGSIRVYDIAQSAKFYAWLFGVEPKEWTHRYVTFVRENPKFNFVLLVADAKELHHDTLYHLGMGVSSKQKVLEFYHSALENDFQIEKPPRTTWRGTPLHELWLKDPDGTLIEIYARLTEDELAAMPEDKEPIFLV